MSPLAHTLLLLGVALFVAVCTCDHPPRCDPKLLYDVTIVYGFDGPLIRDQMDPMDMERNTLARRTNAYKYFSDTFGIKFDPSNSSTQMMMDGMVMVMPMKVPDESRYGVYAFDVRKRFHDGAEENNWAQGLFPLTNARFLDDAYLLMVMMDMRVFGSFGGVQGVVVPAGSMMAFGQYRLVTTDSNGKDSVVTVFHYTSSLPMLPNAFGFTPMTCQVFHPLFGDGLVFGGSYPGGIPGTINTRMVITIPTTRMAPRTDPLPSTRDCMNMPSTLL